MSRHDRSVRTGSDRTNLYDEITTKIIAELEAGRVPWVQPWGTSAAKAPLGLPKNAATSRSYSGINVLTLEKHRTYGTGPAYRKLGGRVVYAIDDLETWAARGAVTSTSDPRGSVLPAKRHVIHSGPQLGRYAR
jgi:hypothetical protein